MLGCVARATSKRAELQLSELSHRLDVLIWLSALSVTKDVKDTAENMRILSLAGFDHSQIAEILNTTAYTIKQRIYEPGKGIREPKKEEAAPAK